MHIVDTPEPTNANDSQSAHDRDPDRVGAVTPGGYETNVTTLAERIAIRMAIHGAEHPVAAAVTIAVRGLSRLESADYAEALGLAPADLRALEAGTVSLDNLPPPLWRMVHEFGLEPLLLVDLDKQLRGT